MYKQDLALNKPQGLICHKTQPNQTFIFNRTVCKKIYILFRTTQKM